MDKYVVINRLDEVANALYQNCDRLDSVTEEIHKLLKYSIIIKRRN